MSGYIDSPVCAFARTLHTIRGTAPTPLTGSGSGGRMLFVMVCKVPPMFQDWNFQRHLCSEEEGWRASMRKENTEEGATRA